MDDHKQYLLEELKQCDQKLSHLDEIQSGLVKFYFTTVFSLATVVIALISYKIYEDVDKLLAWFLLLPLLIFSFVMWFSLKKIMIKYEYFESIRNDISSYFFQQVSVDNKIQAFDSSFKYFYSLISWVFLVILFVFIYKAVPFLREVKFSVYIIIGIAVLISFIIFSIATIALASARKKARDAKRISDIKQLQTAVELFYTDNDSYPIAQNIEELANQISLIKEPYMSRFPVDPINNKEFNYSYKSSDGKDYIINFKLEEGGNKMADSKGIHDQ